MTQFHHTQNGLNYKLLVKQNFFSQIIHPYKPKCGTSANSADPDQTPQNTASDQGQLFAK